MCIIELKSPVTHPCLILKLYREAIPRKLENLREFIIGEHVLNNIRYAKYTMLIADVEEKM